MTHPIQPVDSDPRLDAMLDEALAPDLPQDQLADHIVARTAGRLPRRNVIARIGVPLLRVAAALALVCGVVVALWSLSGPGNDPRRVAGGDAQTTTTTTTIAQLEAHLAELADAADQTDAEALDDRIDLLAVQFRFVEHESPWPSEQELVDQAVTDRQLDELLGEASTFF